MLTSLALAPTASAGGTEIAPEPMMEPMTLPNVHLVCDVNVQLLFDEPITPVEAVIDVDGFAQWGTEATGLDGAPGRCTSPDNSNNVEWGTVDNATNRGPQSCTSANLPDGVADHIWSDGTHSVLKWQFGISAFGPSFSGQVIESTAPWFPVGDQAFIQVYKWTQNDPEEPPIVPCFGPGGVTRDDFIGTWQGYTPLSGVAPSISVTTGPCTVTGDKVAWTTSVTGTGFPSSDLVDLRDTAFVYGQSPGSLNTVAVGLMTKSATAHTDGDGAFVKNIDVEIPFKIAQSPGTINNNADNVFVTSAAGTKFFAISHGGPNFCVA
ncbi:hypothetical protein GCM10022267_91350 [Lentzea roselyniae]|uniref:Uncharacterized protein n=2 Tax=Lentzea roselyniae TaxID=531940 RepID=A0ABP7CLG6_9PSEU